METSLVDSFRWLAKKEDLELESIKFRGEATRYSVLFSKNIDGLVRTRLVIFISAVYICLPLLFSIFAHHDVSASIIIERVIIGIALCICGLLFHRAPVILTIVSLIPLFLIVLGSLFTPGAFNINTISIIVGFMILIGWGIKHQLEANKNRIALKTYLDDEGKLITDES